MMWAILILAFFLYSFLSNAVNKRSYKNSVEVEDYSVERYYVKEDPRFKWNGLIFLITFVSVYIALVLIVDLPFRPYFLLAILLLFLIGNLTDLFQPPSIIKLVGEVGVAALFINGGTYISNLGGILSLWELTNSQVWVFNLFLITFLINSLKQMNAVVGMSVAFAFLNSILFAAFFLYFGPHFHWVIAFLLMLYLMIYIAKNFYQPSNQFGNSGSLLLTGILIFLALELYQVDRPKLAEDGFINILPVVYSFFIVPVYDTVRVMVWRMIKGYSPFRPDQRHFLSLLNVGGYNPTKAMLRIFLIHFAMVALGIYLATTEIYLGFSLLIITAAQIALVEYYTLFVSNRTDNNDIMEVLK